MSRHKKNCRSNNLFRVRTDFITGGGGYGMGPGGYIVCPQCGYKTIHERGVPAYTQRCPKDGSVMVREELLQQVGKQPVNRR